MNIGRQILAATLLPLLIAGCSTRSQPDITVRPPRITTLGLDSRDYNKIAKYMYQSIAGNSKVSQGKVVALGPVTVSPDGKGRFDGRTLQEKLQVTAHRGGLFDFTFAVDAMTQIADAEGNQAAAERFKIMQLQWEKESTVDAEDLRVFGTLANIDYLLFGRMRSQRVEKGGHEEMTYSFNWKLGNCASGLLEWTEEMEFTKSR